MQDCTIYRLENVLTGCISAEILDNFTEEEAEKYISDLCKDIQGVRVANKYSKRTCIKEGEFYYKKLAEVLDGIPYPQFYVTTKD